MKTQSIGLGALVGGLLTVPMVAVMYLADKWLNLSFAPYDIFDWIARILPGPVVTFGIDLMIDSLETLGLNVAATAKTAENTLAVLTFAIAGIVATVIVYGVVGRRLAGSGPGLGLLLGAVLGLPIAIISASMAQSSDPRVLHLPVGPRRVLCLGRRHGRHGPQTPTSVLLHDDRSVGAGGHAVRRSGRQTAVPHPNGCGCGYRHGCRHRLGARSRNRRAQPLGSRIGGDKSQHAQDRIGYRSAQRKRPPQTGSRDAARIYRRQRSLQGLHPFGANGD